MEKNHFRFISLQLFSRLQIYKYRTVMMNKHLDVCIIHIYIYKIHHIYTIVEIKKRNHEAHLLWEDDK